MTVIKVNIEYCNSCGHRKQFMEIAELLKNSIPEVELSGVPGKQGSFEITINDKLVYSKLQTLCFPEYAEVVDVVKEVSQGQSPRMINKQRPIDCILM